MRNLNIYSLSGLPKKGKVSEGKTMGLLPGRKPFQDSPPIEPSTSLCRTSLLQDPPPLTTRPPSPSKIWKFSAKVQQVSLATQHISVLYLHSYVAMNKTFKCPAIWQYQLPSRNLGEDSFAVAPFSHEIADYSVVSMHSCHSPGGDSLAYRQRSIAVSQEQPMFLSNTFLPVPTATKEFFHLSYLWVH